MLPATPGPVQIGAELFEESHHGFEQPVRNRHGEKHDAGIAARITETHHWKRRVLRESPLLARFVFVDFKTIAIYSFTLDGKTFKMMYKVLFILD